MPKTLPRKPNVLLISTDQQRGDCIGPEGRGVKTPNIDRIGTEGVRFSKCITPHPMCQPARASILTGKLPYSTGVCDNGRDLSYDFGTQGLAGLFADAGYDTHFIGKAHLSSQDTFEATGRPECHKSAKNYEPNWNGEYFRFNSVQLMLRPHHHTPWAAPPQTLHYENWLDQDGQGGARWAQAKVSHKPAPLNHQAVRSTLDDQWHSSPWVGDRTVEMIEEKGDAPIFAWVSFPDPHPPFLAPKPWCDMYHPDEVSIAKHRDLDFENRPWWHKAFHESRGKLQQGATARQDGEDWSVMGDMSERAIRELTAIYFGMISAVDQQIGRILDTLDAQGELENTFIIFISDHGEWLGDHGLLLKGPMLYDGLLRVPCLMRGPDLPQGIVVDDPVGTVDIRTTLMDVCDLAGDADNGTSWMGLVTGSESRSHALCEFEVDATRSGIDMDLMTVRSQRYRMSVDLKTETGELYDMENDPDEMINLFEEPDYRAVRQEHMDMIRARKPDQIPRAARVGWH